MQEKRTNRYAIRGTGVERENGGEEIITKKISKLNKDVKHRSKMLNGWTPHRINKKKTIPRHMIVNCCAPKTKWKS